MRRLILFSALALSACGAPETKDSTAGPAPADLASNFSQPIDGRGADAAWTLKIRGRQLTVARPNQPDLVGVAPGAVIEPHKVAWTAVLANGQSMKVSLYASACSLDDDAPSLPFSAEVVLPNAAPLNGCAGPTAAPVKPKP